jgi:hypothetical protein
MRLIESSRAVSAEELEALRRNIKAAADASDNRWDERIAIVRERQVPP